MTFTKRQFTQLQAMGIELWQLKNTAKAASSNIADTLDIELTTLINTTIFNDILTGLGLSIGEVSCENNTLSLGVLTWQFSQQAEISLTQHHLITPAIDVLTNSPQLKQALWHKLEEYSLT